MRKHIVLSASLSLIAGSLAAQYAGEGPGVVNALAAFPSLGATALACAQVQQVGLVPHASLGAGVYYCVATIIPTGGGSSKLQSGTFNAQTGVYTKNTDVDTTTIAGDFAGNVSDDLLTLVTDSSTGPKYQTRLTPSGAWGVRAAITGVPATYNDSNICRVGTQLKYIFINGVAIQFGDFNTTTGVVSNIVTLTTPPAGTTQCHSPAPVFDAAGKCYGITFSSINGAGSSVFLTCALDNTARKDKIMNGTADWIANGSVSGGTVTYAADMAANGTYDDPRQIGLVFTNDTTVPSAGGTVNLRLWAPIKKASDLQSFGVIFLGALGTGPIPIPGILGSPLGLNPVGIVGLPTLPIPQTVGSSGYTFTTGPIPVGLTVATQAAILDLVTNNIYLGSNGKITITP